MKRLARGGVVIILVFLSVNVDWMSSSLDHGTDAGHENGPLKIVTRVKSGRIETIRISTTEFEMNGKKTTIDFPGNDAKDVRVRLAPSVSWKDGYPNGTFWITIKAERPLVLTKEAYEKIQTGMTYPQVGEALGGVMTSGRLSDGFSSKLELIQGKRRVFLTLVDGKVTEKSARNVE